MATEKKPAAKKAQVKPAAVPKKPAKKVEAKKIEKKAVPAKPAASSAQAQKPLPPSPLQPQGPTARMCPLVLDGEISAVAFSPKKCLSCDEFDCRFSEEAAQGSGALRSRLFVSEGDDGEAFGEGDEDGWGLDGGFDEDGDGDATDGDGGDDDSFF